MLTRHPNYYPSFHCLGGDCPDTCCRDWDIVLDQETIEDYQHAPAVLASRLAESLTTDEDGDTCFRLDSRGFCTMLTQDGLCAIQKEWGEAHLCGHCGAYPRFIEEYGYLTESSLAMSCPEAARLLLESPAFQIVEENDGQPDQPFPDIPPQLLAGLESSREEALNAMAQGRYTVWERMQGVLSLAQGLQTVVEGENYPDMVHTHISLHHLAHTEESKDFTVSLCRFFASLEPLRPTWPQRLDKCRQVLEQISQDRYQELCHQFQDHFPQWEQHLSNLACYLIFRHWHKAVNDDQLYGRAAFIACSMILLYHLFLVEWKAHQALPLSEEIAICCAFSREVEHMEENLALAVDTCATLDPASIYFPQ